MTDSFKIMTVTLRHILYLNITLVGLDDIYHLSRCLVSFNPWFYEYSTLIKRFPTCARIMLDQSMTIIVLFCDTINAIRTTNEYHLFGLSSYRSTNAQQQTSNLRKLRHGSWGNFNDVRQLPIRYLTKYGDRNLTIRKKHKKRKRR